MYAELEAERSARVAAEEELARQREVTARVREALDAMREELARMRHTPPAPAPAEPGAPTAERLEAARERLRSVVEAPDRIAQPSAPAALEVFPWLPRAFAGLAAADAAMAGRCVVDLLPALGAVVQAPLSFELRIGEMRLAVEAAPGRASVVGAGAAQPGFRPAFRLRASEAGLGRFAAAPTVGMWLLPPGRVRLRGRRSDAEVLRQLVRAPLGFAELARAGVLLEPELAYGLLAHAIVPAWTSGHSFSVLHETTGPVGARAYVTVNDGRPVTVSADEPAERVVATVSCSPPALLPLLAGVALPAGERAAIRGEPDALAQLQSWIARAQAGPRL
jgi:hypothetical protein